MTALDHNLISSKKALQNRGYPHTDISARKTIALGGARPTLTFVGIYLWSERPRQKSRLASNRESRSN